MNRSRHPAEFYEFVFPDITTSLLKEDHQVFSNHGCFEAINVEFDEKKEKFVVSSKKRKPLIKENDSGDSNWFFMPSHPAISLGQPEKITKLLNIPDKDDIIHYFKARKALLQNFPYANIEDHISNFVLDHPDASQGTFLELYAHYFPYFATRTRSSRIEPSDEARMECGKSAPVRFLTKYNSGATTTLPFPPYLDPFMFDIPHSLLNELLSEELELESKKLLYDSAYTGGALAYKHITDRNNTNYGLLFRPGGQSMNELSIQILCTDTSSQEQCENDIVEEFSPLIHLGVEHRSTLNGRIFQIDSQSSFDDESLFFTATRCMHDVMMTAVNTPHLRTHLDDKSHRDKLGFSADCVKPLGLFHTNQVITSACVNPYIDGECALALDDGRIYIWNASHQPSINTTKATAQLTPSYKETLSSHDDGWRQVEFGAQPRQLLVACRRGVKLVDLRGKFSSTRQLCGTKGRYEDSIMTILSGSNFSVPNEFQVAIATPTELTLHDIRYHKVPLLRWKLNLRTPCQYLSVIGSTQDDDLFNLNSIIFAASQRSQEMHMYQYNTKSKARNPLFHSGSSSFVLHPPVSIAPPYDCETFKDVRRSLGQEFFRSQAYIEKRLCYPIIGVTGYCYKTTGGQKVAVSMQVSACGDVLYQPFISQEPKVAWEKHKVVSGCAAELSKPPTKIRKLAERDRLKWALQATDLYREGVEKENPLNIRCTHTTLNAMVFSSHKFMEDYVKAPRDTSKACVMCKEDRSNMTASTINEDLSDEIPLNKSKCNSPAEDNKCSACGVDKSYVESMVMCKKSGRLYQRNFVRNIEKDGLWCSDGQKSELPELNVQPLKLVNPSVTKSGLGRLLLTTWDSTYEEFWDTLKSETASKRSKRKAENMRDRLDLSFSDNPPTEEMGQHADRAFNNPKNLSTNFASTSTIDQVDVKPNLFAMSTPVIRSCNEIKSVIESIPEVKSPCLFDENELSNNTNLPENILRQTNMHNLDVISSTSETAVAVCSQISCNVKSESTVSQNPQRSSTQFGPKRFKKSLKRRYTGFV